MTDKDLKLKLLNVDSISGEKGGGGSSPVEHDDNLFSHQTAKVIDVISEGQISSVDQVYLDENPIENFPRASFAIRKGETIQEPVLGFTNVSSSSLDNMAVRFDTPIIRAVSTEGVHSVLLTVGVEALFLQTEDGDLVGHNTTMLIHTRDTTGGVWSLAETVNFNGKTMNPYQRGIRINAPSNPPPNAWEWRVSAETADSISTKDVRKLYLFSHDEIQDVDNTYPDTAYVSTFIPAEQTQGRIPKRSFDVHGIICQVPSNYDPINRTYTGIWNGSWDVVKRYTDNPAWILFDLLTNTRYGAGHPENRIDKFSFYDVGVYNDEIVQGEPRFTFGSEISKTQDAWKMVHGIASTCHGFVLEVQGIITFFQDRPVSVSNIVTNNDVKEGIFNYQSGALSTRANQINVTYNDASNNFLKDIVPVRDDADIAAYGLTEKNIIAYACTNQAQAIRIGRWHLKTELSDPETVEFTTSLNRAGIEFYSRINIQDENWSETKASGRVISTTTNTVVIDYPLTLEAESYTISYYNTNEEFIEDIPIDQSDVATSTLTGIDIGDAKVNTSFLLKSTTQPERSFRIVKVEPDFESNEISFTGLLYDKDKWTEIESGIDLPDDWNPSVNIATQSPVQNLVITAEHSANLNVSLRVDWEIPVDGTGYYYLVTWKRSNGNWNKISGITITEHLIENALPGDYEISVYAINIAGVVSAETTDTFTLNSDSTSELNSPINIAVTDGQSSSIFDTPDCKIKWDNNPVNADLDNVIFKDTKIEVWDSAGTSLKSTYYTSDTDFVYYYAQNNKDFGTPTRNVQFRLYARDVQNQLSVAAILSASNPQPTAVSLTLTPGFDLMHVDIAPPIDRDVKGYRVYAHSTQGFTPSGSNLIYDGPSPSYAFAIPAGQTLYYRAAAYDNFDIDNLNLSSEYSDAALGIVDYAPEEYQYYGQDFNVSGTNTVVWQAGTGVNLSDGALFNTDAGSAVWSSGVLYIYNQPGSASILTTEYPTTAIASGGVILATYRGGNDLLAFYGGAYIDGSKIIAQSITAGSLVSDQVIITDTLQLASGVIQEANIGNLAVTNEKIANVLQSTNWDDILKLGWKLDKQGTFQGQGISIFNNDGELILGSGSINPGRTVQDSTFEYKTNFWTTTYTGEFPAATTVGSIVNESNAEGGSVWEIQGNPAPSGLYMRNAIPVQTDKLYRMRVRVRQTVAPSVASNDVFYAGLMLLDSSYNPIPSESTRFCCASEQLNDIGVWKEFEANITGIHATDANSFGTDTQYVRPVFYVNQPSGDGTVQVDAVQFHEVPTIAQSVSQGVGTNLLYNAGFRNESTHGWATYTPANITAGLNLGVGGDWQINGPYGTLYVEEVAPSVSGSYWISENSLAVPVEEGKRYEVSAYTGAHRCTVNVFVACYDRDENMLYNGPVGINNASEKVGGKTLAEYKRIGGIYTAPTGAATLRIQLVKGATNVGEPHSYMFATLPYLGEAAPGQTELSPWNEGASLLDQQGSLATKSAVDLTSNEVIGKSLANLDAAQDGKLNGISPGADVTNYVDTRISNINEHDFMTTITEVARYVQEAGSVVGAIKIKLPQSWSNTMISFDVDVYNYVLDLSFTLHIAGFNPVSYWYNQTANLQGSTAAEQTVRFGHDATTCCIFIGELSTVWQYPKVRVHNFQAGHSNYQKGFWDSGWEISIVSALDTVHRTISDALLDARAIKNQGGLATRDNISWGAGDIVNEPALGNMSVLNSITAANVSQYFDTGVFGSTFIEDASILNAKIANEAVDNSKIANLAVDQLKLQGHMLTIPRGSAGSGFTIISTGDYSNSGAGAVFISCNGEMNTEDEENTAWLQRRLNYGAWVNLRKITVRSTNIEVDHSVSIGYVDSPGNNTVSYRWGVSTTGGYAAVKDPSIIALSSR